MVGCLARFHRVLFIFLRRVTIHYLRDSVRTPAVGDSQRSTWWVRCERKNVFCAPKSLNPEIPTTMKTMGVNVTIIAYLRVLIIKIGSTIILMVVETQGKEMSQSNDKTGCLTNLTKMFTLSTTNIETETLRVRRYVSFWKDLLVGATVSLRELPILEKSLGPN